MQPLDADGAALLQLLQSGGAGGAGDALAAQLQMLQVQQHQFQQQQQAAPWQPRQQSLEPRGREGESSTPRVLRPPVEARPNTQ